MTLNAPRAQSYDFRVFALEGWAWLFDNSERTYLCSSTPNIYAEPLYPLSFDDDFADPPVDEGYFAVSRGDGDSDTLTVWGHEVELHRLPLDADEIAVDVEETDAWDSAREEAHANCVV